VRRAVVVLVAVVVLAAALGASAPAASAATTRDVVTSFYPLAYAAQQVGGRRVAVTNLTPAGAEPHDLELTPRQIDAILDADVVFDMGRNFQPAVEAAAGRRDGPTVSLLDDLAKTGRRGKDRTRVAAKHDPHVWLDPVLMRAVVARVAREMSSVDPKGASTYDANAKELDDALVQLDADYRSGLANCDRHVILTSHDAFGYLADEYGLRQEGVAGLSPDAEPDPKRIAQLVDRAKRDGVTVVFTETLVSPRIADTLAREAGLRTETLDPLEGLTDDEIAHGASYLTVMRQNLTKLRSALGCH